MKYFFLLFIALMVTILGLFPNGYASEDEYNEHHRYHKEYSHEKYHNNAGQILEFYGHVKKRPAEKGFVGTWIIGGRLVEVTPHTRIKEKHGPLKEGAYVEVKGRYDHKKEVIKAYEIEVKSLKY